MLRTIAFLFIITFCANTAYAGIISDGKVVAFFGEGWASKMSVVHKGKLYFCTYHNKGGDCWETNSGPKKILIDGKVVAFHGKDWAAKMTVVYKSKLYFCEHHQKGLRCWE